VKPAFCGTDLLSRPCKVKSRATPGVAKPGEC
jgi:hypothetical protein